jgi:hypothetical protein
MSNANIHIIIEFKIFPYFGSSYFGNISVEYNIIKNKLYQCCCGQHLKENVELQVYLFSFVLFCDYPLFQILVLQETK